MPIPTLSDLDQSTLTPIVAAALGTQSAEVVEWHVIPLLESRASPAGVYRVTGSAQDQGQTRAWSVVVKVLEAAKPEDSAGNQASDNPIDEYYWRRELLLFQSGFFDTLPAGFTVPRCYRIDESPQGGRIWMEDVTDEFGAHWPLEHYGLVARHFGRFNGAYLAGKLIPTWPWFTKDFLVRRIQRCEWPKFWQNYPTLRHENALVQHGWSDKLATGVNRIWEDRELFLQTLAHLPQTLLHNDGGRKNLFARRDASGDLETVVIDWGLIERGAIGQDLAVVVSQPVYWFNGVRPDQLPELDQIAFAGYLQGLRDAGWQGDPAQARLGYTTTVALRGSIGIAVVEWMALNDARRLWLEGAMGHPIEEIVDVFRGFREFVVACAEEARQLIATQVVQR